MRGTSGAIRWYGEKNDSVYEKCGMGTHVNGVNCGVVEWGKKNILKWFGHIERIKREEFVKKVYVREIASLNRGDGRIGYRSTCVKEVLVEGISKRARPLGR